MKRSPLLETSTVVEISSGPSPVTCRPRTRTGAEIRARRRWRRSTCRGWCLVCDAPRLAFFSAQRAHKFDADSPQHSPLMSSFFAVALKSCFIRGKCFSPGLFSEPRKSVDSFMPERTPLIVSLFSQEDYGKRAGRRIREEVTFAQYRRDIPGWYLSTGP